MLIIARRCIRSIITNAVEIIDGLKRCKPKPRRFDGSREADSIGYTYIPFEFNQLKPSVPHAMVELRDPIVALIDLHPASGFVGILCGVDRHGSLECRPPGHDVCMG